MARRRVTRTPAKPLEEEELVQEELEDEEDLEDEEPEAPKPAPRRRKVRTAAVPDEGTSATPDITPETTIASVTGNELADAIVAALDAGRTLEFRRVGPKYVIAHGATTEVVQTVVKRSEKALTRAEAYDIAQTDEYKEFLTWWPALEFEEKVKLAKKAKVKWEEHDSELINNMRLAMAYQESQGIEKWKPQYQSSKVRRELELTGVELPDPEESEE